MCSATMAVTAGCGVVWEGRAIVLLTHLASIPRVLMPPSRTSRNFGVGRAVYGISDVVVPVGGYTLLVGHTLPDNRSVRPI